MTLKDDSTKMIMDPKLHPISVKDQKIKSTVEINSDTSAFLKLVDKTKENTEDK